MLPVRTLFIINTVFVGLIALISIFVPLFILELNGVEVNDFTLNLQRAVGAVSVGYGVASWLMRDSQPSEARRAFLIGTGVGYFVVAAVFLFNKLSSELGTSSVWVYIVISLLLGLDFVVYGFKEPAEE